MRDDLLELLDSYKNFHSIEALEMDKNLCSRKYVVSDHFGCDVLGNNYGRFLNDLTWAVLLNRTFVSNWESRNCFDALFMSQWLPTVGWLINITTQHGCPPINKVFYRGSPHKNIPLRCCNIETSNITAFSFGSFDNDCFKYFHPLSGSSLSPMALKRARIMFPSSNSVTKYDSFGFITRFSSYFSPKVELLARDALNEVYENLDHTSSQDSILIGLHVRHQKNDIQSEHIIDSLARECLSFVRGLTKGKKCIVLFATDRAHSLESILSFAKEIDCEIRYIAKNVNTTHHSQLGPWADSVLSIADWRLLSQSDIFIGTTGSSFSALIANLVAARATGRTPPAVGDPLMWIHPGMGCVVNREEVAETGYCNHSTAHFNHNELLCTN